MTVSPEDDQRRQHHALQRIERTAELRQQQREAVAVLDADTERLRGENERAAMQLRHELDIENRNLDLQDQALRDALQIRLESLQTTLRQHDDFFRHFWALDQELLTLEGRIAEKLIDGGIRAKQSALDHHHAMESKASDQAHEIVMAEEARKSATHANELDKDNFEFKERLRLKLAREHGQLSAGEVADIMAVLNGKP